MRRRHGRSPLTLLLVTLAFVGPGCLHQPGDPRTERASLPSWPPPVHQLALSASADRFPLRPARDRAPFTSPVLTKIRAATRTLDLAGVREAAELHPLVIKELSEEYAHFHTEVVEHGPGACPPQVTLADKIVMPSAPPPIQRLTYYSYTRNATVVVCMRGRRFLSVGLQKDYQPPERPEEVSAAVELAARDPRLAPRLRGRAGKAVLMEPDAGILFDEPGAGNRVFWVTFSAHDDLAPEYWAVVDLTRRQVLMVGEEAEP